MKRRPICSSRYPFRFLAWVATQRRRTGGTAAGLSRTTCSANPPRRRRRRRPSALHLVDRSEIAWWTGGGLAPCALGPCALPACLAPDVSRLTPAPVMSSRKYASSYQKRQKKQKENLILKSSCDNLEAILKRDGKSDIDATELYGELRILQRFLSKRRYGCNQNSKVFEAA